MCSGTSSGLEHVKMGGSYCVRWGLSFVLPGLSLVGLQATIGLVRKIYIAISGAQSSLWLPLAMCWEGSLVFSTICALSSPYSGSLPDPGYGKCRSSLFTVARVSSWGAHILVAVFLELSPT